VNTRWQVRTLAEVCEIVNGGTPKTGVREYWGGPHRWITPAEMGRRTTPYVIATARTLTDSGLSESSARLLPPHSVILSSRAPIGHLVINSEPMATNQGCKGLVPRDGIQHKFLYYFLAGSVDLLNSLGTGATFKELSAAKLKEVAIPVPPADEQRRLVGILDQAFEGIATAKTNAEQSLRSARALLESHLEVVFKRRGTGWAVRRLGDVVTRLTNGYVGPTRNIYQQSGVPYLLARHVKNNRLLFDGKTFISDEFNRKNKKSLLRAGDVLLVQSGHIGHSAVVTEEHEGHNCHAMIVISAAEGAYIGAFLSLFFNSTGMKETFQKIRSGSTVPHLTCGEVKEVLVPLPDLATQQRVVDHARELERESRRLGGTYERKLEKLDNLRHSFLHQAFTGQL
jgi:type I restriction enzyme S subunit